MDQSLMQQVYRTGGLKGEGPRQGSRHGAKCCRRAQHFKQRRGRPGLYAVRSPQGWPPGACNKEFATKGQRQISLLFFMSRA